MSGKMTPADAARIQSSNDKTGNDSGFKARAQAAAAHNTNAQTGTGNAGSNSSSGGKK